MTLHLSEYQNLIYQLQSVSQDSELICFALTITIPCKGICLKGAAILLIFGDTNNLKHRINFL